MDYKTIEVEQRDRIGILRLNRPDKLNAISHDVITEIVSVLDRYAADDAIRSVVLAANGRAFSAGYELGATFPDDVEKLRGMNQASDAFAAKVWKFPKPIVAAVQGYCLAGACEIAMLCDITVAGESARFGEPEIRFGVGSTLVMPWVVPMKIAKELLLGGGQISAERAYQVGMVNKVVPDADLFAEALRFAGLLATVPAPAAQLTKRGINAAYERAGMWQAAEYHAELVTHMMRAFSEEQSTFHAITQAEGLRAAIRWRDSQFKRFEEQQADRQSPA